MWLSSVYGSMIVENFFILSEGSVNKFCIKEIIGDILF